MHGRRIKNKLRLSDEMKYGILRTHTGTFRLFSSPPASAENPKTYFGGTLMEIFIGITAAILAVGLVAFTVIYNVKRHKSGKGGCCGDCGKCKGCDTLKTSGENSGRKPR